VTEEVLSKYQFETVLEMGCGTGKNTDWLVSQANQVFSFDFSAGMLVIAKDKVQSENVQFQKADLTKEWDAQNEFTDLVTFNLVLEHVEDLGFVFSLTSF
jgi:malonyl-CoA O-methyltransferase